MSIYSSACKHDIRLQFINLGCIQLNYKSFKTYLIRCTVGLFTFLFTIRLVNFIKFADYFHLVAVNTYFYLIHNYLVTPPARRAWRNYKFASLGFSVFFFFSVSKVGLPLMGVTAVHSCLSHDF